MLEKPRPINVHIGLFYPLDEQGPGTWTGGVGREFGGRAGAGNEALRIGYGWILPAAEIGWWEREPLGSMSGMVQDVRRIEAAEWPRFRQLRLEALRDSPLAFVEQYDQALAQPDEHWQERVRRGAEATDAATFVAVAAGELVGKATCFIEPEVTEYVSGHLVGVYVSPTFRGRGIAEAVVEAAIRWAREGAHAAQVRLFVIESNDRAMAFYRRLGFVPTGATMVYPPDPAYTEYELVRPG